MCFVLYQHHGNLCACAVSAPTGLTQLSYSSRAGSGSTAISAPEPPEGSAAAQAAILIDPQPDPPASTSTDKLRLDARLMQTLMQVMMVAVLVGTSGWTSGGFSQDIGWWTCCIVTMKHTLTLYCLLVWPAPLYFHPGAAGDTFLLSAAFGPYIGVCFVVPVDGLTVLFGHLGRFVYALNLLELHVCVLFAAGEAAGPGVCRGPDWPAVQRLGLFLTCGTNICQAGISAW